MIPIHCRYGNDSITYYNINMILKLTIYYTWIPIQRHCGNDSITYNIQY